MLNPTRAFSWVASTIDGWSRKIIEVTKATTKGEEEARKKRTVWVQREIDERIGYEAEYKDDDEQNQQGQADLSSYGFNISQRMLRDVMKT
jgi:hypothetical protein